MRIDILKKVRKDESGATAIEYGLIAALVSVAASGAGDVDGDGFDDLIVGAYGDDPNGSFSGASFVVFGGDFTNSVDVLGTAGNDTLLGSVVGDIMNGAQGDDTLIGNAGDDRLTGALGDDTFVYTSITDGDDVITDLVIADDTVDLDALFDALGVTTAEFRADDVKITDTGADGVLTIDGVADFSITFTGENFGGDGSFGQFDAAQLAALGIDVGTL